MPGKEVKFSFGLMYVHVYLDILVYISGPLYKNIITSLIVWVNVRVCRCVTFGRQKRDPDHNSKAKKIIYVKVTFQEIMAVYWPKSKGQ